MKVFTYPMQPWTDLAPFARQIPLPASGIRLFVYDAGSGDLPPTLLIHGLGDEADTWRYIFPALAKECRVIALDLPGFGRSDQPDRSYTLSFFEETLLELIDVLELAKVRLIGHSMGAGIAQALALDHRDRMDSLVLVSGSLVSREQPVTPQTLLFLVPGLGEWLYNRLRRDPQAAYQTLEPYYSHLEALSQADRDFLYQRVNERVWSDSQRRAFLSTLRNLARTLPGMQKVLPARLIDFNIPTLVIWGEADRINPIVNAQALTDLQSSARLVTVPGAGHNLQQEVPAEVLQAIQGLNSSKEPRKRTGNHE